MLYFKLPYSENLHSTDNNPNISKVSFFPFLENENRIDIKGNIIKTENLNFIIDLQQSPLTNEETESQYLQKLEQVIKTIKDYNLPKLVISRRKIITFDKIDIVKSFENICSSYPNAFRYIFSENDNCWMGAFSEVLGKFNKKTSEFETMSLAGTLPLEEEWTKKEIEEQKPVTIYIKNILEKYSSEIQISETYTHPSGNIKHLRTDFSAKINHNNLDNIITNLHPTPAVCGIPKDVCNREIQRFEKYPRELYAGYIKIEMDDFIYYFVNLRCTKIFDKSAHLFVGGGITAQSQPQKEWHETELKSQAVMKNLVIS